MKAQLPTTIAGIFPPAIVNTGSGRYLVGGDKWYEVDDSFTLEDARKLWQRKTSTTLNKQVRSTFRVSSSKPGKYYTVSNDISGWSCSCTGFGFRRDCKHVQAMKKKVQ